MRHGAWPLRGGHPRPTLLRTCPAVKFVLWRPLELIIEHLDDSFDRVVLNLLLEEVERRF